MLFFAEPSAAFNLGALQKSSSADVSAGDTAVFRILFWNAEPGEYQLTISDFEVPNGWIVLASPQQFMLNSTPFEKTERIYLSSAKNTISAKAVDIFVTVPENEVIGEYAVVLYAVAGSGSSGSFSIMQERRFLFNLNVVKGKQKTSYSGAQKNMISAGKDSSEIEVIQITSNETVTGKSGLRSVAYAFGIIAILLIAWRVYKYE